jgi:hypothetical protein
MKEPSKGVLVGVDNGWVYFNRGSAESLNWDYLPKLLQRELRGRGPYRVTRVRRGGICVELERGYWFPAVYAETGGALCARLLRGMGIKVSELPCTVRVKVEAK